MKDIEHPFDCISKLIFVEDEIEKSDVILIPGSSQYQLMERAVELYNKDLAKYIIPSGGHNKSLMGYDTEWEYLQTVAIRLGIPEKVILREDKAKNTFENAQFSWELIQKLNISIENVILVCKGYHSRRALLTYKSIFPKNVNFYVSPIIDKREISKDNWYLDNKKIQLVMNEVVKIGRYFEDKILNWI